MSNIVYYNPPYNSAVKTRIGSEFLRIVQRHFGHERKDKLHTIFNKHTMKLSYSCTKNLGAIFSAHNARALQDSIKKPQKNVKECNCLKSRKEDCPMKGKCQHQDRGVVYRATATADDGVIKTYTGSTDNFKKKILRTQW